MTGRRDERAAVLQAIETEMEGQRLRGHIYLTKRVTIAFATRRARRLNALPRNIGPKPVIRAITNALGRTTADAWLAQLRQDVEGDAPAPPAVWNTPHLVVTGAMPQRSLFAACEHPDAYEPGILELLQAECGLDDEGTRQLYQRLRPDRDNGGKAAGVDSRWETRDSRGERRNDGAAGDQPTPVSR